MSFRIVTHRPLRLKCISSTSSLLQDVTGVETTNLRYSFNGSMSSSRTLTGDYFEFTLPGAEGGDVVSVTVMFENGTCMSSMTANYTGEC